MLLIDYPKSVFFPEDKQTFFTIPEDKALDFNQFEALIRTINMFQVYLDELEGIFRHLDFMNEGKVVKEELFKAIDKLEGVNSSEQSDFIALKIPTFDELKQVWDNIKQENKEYYTYEEFLQILMNVYSIENSDEDDY